MNKWLASVTLVATSLSAQAIAQERGGLMQDMTRAQAQHMADDIFQRFDVNHRGVISRQEALQSAAQLGEGERAQRMIDRIFGNAQSLTLAQFEAKSLARFDRDDLNHDGTVTVAERQQARAALKADRAAQAPVAPVPPPPGQ
jgi:hypothetical protein